MSGEEFSTESEFSTKSTEHITVIWPDGSTTQYSPPLYLEDFLEAAREKGLGRFKALLTTPEGAKKLSPDDFPLSHPGTITIIPSDKGA